MHKTVKTTRNREILAARNKGQTLQQIADTHNLTRQRVRQILKNGCEGKTLTVLPGTALLSPATRGLLIREGYRSTDAILADLKTGKLHVGCAFGLGIGRFSEIENWASKQGHPLVLHHSPPSNRSAVNPHWQHKQDIPPTQGDQRIGISDDDAD